MLIDTHAHLYAKQFDQDREEMIQRAIDNGVTKLFLPNIDINSIEGMFHLADIYPDVCYPMMGLHPCSVKADYLEVLEVLEAHLRAGNPEADEEGQFCAVGEIGLDYHWDTTFKKQQKDALRIQINWAKELNLPIVLHCRKSFKETLKIVKEMQDGNLKGIFHCFGGSVEEAQQVIDVGFLMGIGGVLTFKKSGLDKTLAEVPLEHLVLETDAPYLAPSPYRGKRNESAYIANIADKLAEVKNCSVEKIAAITSKNALALFKR